MLHDIDLYMIYFQFDDQPGGNPLPKVDKQKGQPQGTQEKDSDPVDQSNEVFQQPSGACDETSKKTEESST